MKKSLSQYYTSSEVSTLLVSLIDLKSVESVLDLGAGEGALVNEVYKVLRERSSYIVADIDAANCHKLKKNKDYKVYNIDCTSLYLSRRIHCKYGTIDLAVCNPPYDILENNKYYTKFLQ